MTKIRAKMILMTNRKVPTKGDSYTNIVFTWIVAGFCWASLLLTLPLRLNGTLDTPWFMIGLVGFAAIALPVWGYRIDRRYGYLDVIHEQRLKRREIALTEAKTKLNED